MDGWLADTRTSYDTVAVSYAELVRDALAGQPYLLAFGIDLSPGMIEVARRDHSGLRFEVGSMTELDLPAASVAGLLGWQSLIHIPDDEVSTVFGHFRRVLRPGGPLQLLFHVGDRSRLKTRLRPSDAGARPPSSAGSGGGLVGRRRVRRRGPTADRSG